MTCLNDSFLFSIFTDIWEKQHISIIQARINLFKDCGIDITNISYSKSIQSHQGKTALCVAAEAGNVEVAKILFRDGAKINKCDRKKWTPLHFACKHLNYEMVMFLCENGAQIFRKNKKGNIPFEITQNCNENKSLANKAEINRYLSERIKVLRSASYTWLLNNWMRHDQTTLRRSLRLQTTKNHKRKFKI
jgi:hypothetical protein